MAFYHFLAIFPVLLLFLAAAGKVPHFGEQSRNTILDLSSQVLPKDASSLFSDVLNELNQRALSASQVVPALFGGMWAAFNGIWALMFGLNTAYEVQERRPWWKLALTIVGLAISLSITGLAAVFLIVFGADLRTHLSRQDSTSIQEVIGFRVLQWAVIIALLLFSFALIYRFAPNLRDHKWRWSTPGALFALCAWVAATIAMRFYFEHISDYRRAYGHLNRVVMLLLWLYVSNGAILIGGEMNSEIEKAGDREDQPEAAASKSGGSGARSGS